MDKKENWGLDLSTEVAVRTCGAGEPVARLEGLAKNTRLRRGPAPLPPSATTVTAGEQGEGAHLLPRGAPPPGPLGAGGRERGGGTCPPSL